MLSRRQFKIAKNPWITSGILTSIKHRNKLYAMYSKNKCPKMFASYKKYRNKPTHIKVNVKQNYFEHVFRSPRNLLDTWKNINQILRKSQLKTTKIPNAVKVDSKTITDPTQICNKLNEHLVTVGEKLDFKSTASKSKNYLKYLGKRQVSFIVLRPTDAYKVIETIAGLKDNKSLGYIDIPVTLIKEAKFIIAHYLARSLNNCLEKGNYLITLKIAKVVSLHKGGYQMNLSNDKPISVLSPLNKVF